MQHINYKPAGSNVMPFTKIDSEGHYSKFPGVTVISSVRDEDLRFWLDIYNCLASDDSALGYFSPLPCYSYHMTTTNLFTHQDDGGDDWDGFLDDERPRCQELHRLLTTHEFTPTLSFGEIITSGVIQLVVTLPDEQVETIRAIAKKVGMDRAVPHFFHITLAYQYKPIPEAVETEISARLQERLRLILDSRSSGISLDPPTLCSFYDMTAFKPWDGSPSGPMRPYFFWETIAGKDDRTASAPTSKTTKPQ